MDALADRRVFRTIVLGLLLAGGLPGAAAPAAAQAPMALERIASGSGLSQNTVYAIAQDRSGFLWVATRDGLNRYDGYGFVTDRHDPDDPRSLCHNHVLSLFESAAGELWVGTETGLCRYDRAANRFERVAHASQGTLQVITIREDRDGRLWLMDNSAITRLDVATGVVRSFAPLPVRRMVSVAGEIWIDTPDGARRYDPASDTWIPVDLPPPGLARPGGHVPAAAAGIRSFVAARLTAIGGNHVGRRTPCRR